ncbi:MAG TPA: energy-coupling factor transporter ATPase [Ktedonobacteraceae bacterium]|nr:energy-coupling factor transporter ATPase [Ktedonobacteraceae bacterium]
MSTAMSVDGLWWRYPTFSEETIPWLLRALSFSIQHGECFGITGASGAGKSTLCRALLGIIPHNARLTSEQLPNYFRGTMQIFGEAVTAQTARTQRVGMVLQDPENQFLRMSLLHELALGLQLQDLPNEEILARAYHALNWVGLGHLWHGAAYLHPADLSGGQKQRVAIASFLAMRPRILILDEPTSDLDPVGKREVIETLARLRRDYHMTVILVEQDPEILATFCDRIALLHQGKLALVAPPAQFYTERALLEDSGASVGELTRIAWNTGHTYQARPPLTLDEAATAFAITTTCAAPPDDVEPVTTTNEPVIEAHNVRYDYGDGTTALSSIDLTLHRGEMLALLGPNGSGKTTFAKILAGIYRPTGGQVRVLGQDLATRKVRRLLARSVGYVFQNPDHQLFCRKVSDEIEYGLKNLGMNVAQRKVRCEATLEAVNLSDYANEDPLFLSKGQRQRLAVAAILAMGPDILIIDEPTTGQDSRSISSIMSLLRTLQQQGKTILIITHDMTLVTEYCQRVVAFRDGHVSFTGTPQALFTDLDMLQQTGLQPPGAAQLTLRLRALNPQFPPLLTVAHWTDALSVVKANGD